MKILIANPGSTSYKCKLYDMGSNNIIFSATVEKIGYETGIYTYKTNNSNPKKKELQIQNYTEAINLTIKSIEKFIPIKEITAVGFKVVLAKDITGCVEITDKVIKALQDFMPLAPVHNQVYLNAISIFKNILPSVPLIGLFETSFHKDIPEEAYLYGVPYEWYLKYGVRKYGFHGASHRYISKTCKELYFKDTDSYKIISCHLGGSSSVCAIKNGISIDTSMGMSPQSGLLNAKRVGDLDTFALLYIMEKENLSIEEIRKVLITKSGVFGISGISGDLRDIESGMLNNKRAESAFKTFAYYVKRYIGEYLAVLNSADIITFTGGIGQHSPTMRKEILKNMENLGILLDDEKNATTTEGLISKKESKIKIAVLPTNEELIVATEVKNFLNNKRR